MSQWLIEIGAMSGLVCLTIGIASRLLRLYRSWETKKIMKAFHDETGRHYEIGRKENK